MFSFDLQAQSTEKYKQYKFKLECPMFRCDINGKIIDSTQQIAEINSKFLLIYSERDECIIRFLVNTKRNAKRNLNLTGHDKTTFRYYLIKQAQLDFKAEPADFKQWNLTVGNVVTPIKLRFNPFVFNKDFTIGPTFGTKYKPNQYSLGSINMVLGIGISSVTLDSLSTSGFINKTQEYLAFTPSVGIMLEVRNSQFGIFSGFDLLSSASDVSKYYIYKKSPWISIGFGYAIFSSK